MRAGLAKPSPVNPCPVPKTGEGDEGGKVAIEIRHTVPMYKIVNGEHIELDPKHVGRMEVCVDFDGVLETRHARLDRATKTWFIHNSTAAKKVRLAAVKLAEAAITAVGSLEEAIKDIESKIAKMARKKGVKTLRDELKFAKRRLVETSTALEAAKANREKVGKDFPEFVAFQR